MKGGLDIAPGPCARLMRSCSLNVINRQCSDDNAFVFSNVHYPLKHKTSDSLNRQGRDMGKEEMCSSLPLVSPASKLNITQKRTMTKSRPSL